MAKIINHPFKRTILSAAGSAEVIAKGFSNDYVTKWRFGGDTSWESAWDKADSFPTVVRVGNFVWCYYMYSSSSITWILIDVVPDPEVEYQLGNNLAYPPILNETVPSIYKADLETIKDFTDIGAPIPVSTDGPYTSLSLTTTGNHLTDFGHVQSTFIGDHFPTEIILDTDGWMSGTWGGYFNASATHDHIPLCVGWGSLQSLLENDGSEGAEHYGLWPPFATKEQFTTLYGKEADWVHSTHNASHSVMFDQVASQEEGDTGRTVEFNNPATLTAAYPFTVEEIIPQTLYKDIPGDTNQDGIDDSISPAEALLLLEGASGSLLPSLDISKCVGFDIDLPIKLPTVDMSFAKDAINKLKAEVASAVSSTALSEIAEKAEGLKATLLASLPELPEFPNLAAELAKLNPLDLSAIDALKEKWGGVYGDIESLLSDLGNIDVCSLVGVDAKIGPDGLILKSKPPEPPEKPVEEPTQNISVPYSSQDHPQDQFQADRGLSLARTAELEKLVNDAWKKVEKSSAYSSFLEDEADIKRKIIDFEARKEVQQLALRPSAPLWVNLTEEFAQPSRSSLLNTGSRSLADLEAKRAEKLAGQLDVTNLSLQELIDVSMRGGNFRQGVRGIEEDILTEDQIKEEEEKLYPAAYIASSITRAISSARRQITAKLMSSNQSGITPTSDPSAFWLPPSLIDVGSKIPAAVGKSGALFAVFMEETRDTIVEQYIQINKAIEEHIFTEEILSAAEDVVIGKGSPHTNKNTTNKRSSGYSGAEGDASSEIPNRSAGNAKAPPSGEVKYCEGFEGNIRNQPIQQSLMDILVGVCITPAGPGYSMLIVSGGQDYKGTPGARRTGSVRHDGGYAADVTIYSKEGRKLSGGSSNTKDIEAMKILAKHFKDNGITSIGAGPGYQLGNWHVDISSAEDYKGHWGVGGSSIKAPDWLKESFPKIDHPTQASAARAALETLNATNAPLLDGLPTFLPPNVPGISAPDAEN